MISGRDAGAGVLHFDQHVFADRHALVLELRALVGADIGGAQRELAALRHRVAGVDPEIDDDLLELREVGLHRPQVALRHGVERDALADQPLEQHVQVVNHLAEVDDLRAQRLLARERQQVAHQRGGAVGVLPDLDDVLERRVGRLVRVHQEVRRHHDGAEHVVEVVRDAAGELADQLHLLLLVELVLQAALLGGLQRIDDGGLVIAVLLDRCGEKACEAFAGAFERGIDRIDLALLVGGAADRGFERRSGRARRPRRGSNGRRCPRPSAPD